MFNETLQEFVNRYCFCKSKTKTLIYKYIPKLLHPSSSCALIADPQTEIDI